MVDDRPNKPDFHWLVRNITRVAVGYGFSVKADNRPPGFPITYEELSSNPAMLNYTFDKLFKEISTVWNVDHFESAWRAYLQGKKPIDRFSAQYCFDKLLSDTDRNLREEGVRTDENARALSVAIKQELPNELGRYKSVNNDRMREIDQTLQVDFKVTQVMAAERLRVGTRWIRKLVKQGKLEKLATGSIKSQSLLKLLAKRGESTSS